MGSSTDDDVSCVWDRAEKETGFLITGPGRILTWSSESMCGRMDMKEALKSLTGESSCGGLLDTGGAGKREVGDDKLKTLSSFELAVDGREWTLSISQRLSLPVPGLGDVGS